jgi:hypothetical protein
MAEGLLVVPSYPSISEQHAGAPFCEAESTFEYMKITQRYLLEYGKPVALYSDKHAVFRVNKAGATRGEGITQFGRRCMI